MQLKADIIKDDALRHVLNMHAEYYRQWRANNDNRVAEANVDTSAALISILLGVSGSQLHTAVVAIMEQEVTPAESGEAILALLGLVKV